MTTEAQLPPTSTATPADPVGSPSTPSWQGTNSPAKSWWFSDSFGYWGSPPRGQIKCQLMKEEHGEWPILLVACSYQIVSNLLKQFSQAFFHNFTRIFKNADFIAKCTVSRCINWVLTPFRLLWLKKNQHQTKNLTSVLNGFWSDTYQVITISINSQDETLFFHLPSLLPNPFIDELHALQ